MADITHYKMDNVNIIHYKMDKVNIIHYFKMYFTVSLQLDQSKLIIITYLSLNFHSLNSNLNINMVIIIGNKNIHQSGLHVKFKKPFVYLHALFQANLSF